MVQQIGPIMRRWWKTLNEKGIPSTNTCEHLSCPWNSSKSWWFFSGKTKRKSERFLPSLNFHSNGRRQKIHEKAGLQYIVNEWVDLTFGNDELKSISNKDMDVHGFMQHPSRHQSFVLHVKCNTLTQITDSKGENSDRSNAIEGQMTLLIRF